MKQKYSLFILCLFVAVSLSAQTTYTVSSSADDGPGTLRNLITNALPEDIIKIPADFTIVLDSEINIAQHIIIDGQGATVKTVDPGISPYRLFTLGLSSGNTIYNITFNNVKFRGGDVRLNTEGTAPNHGGAILILKRVNLILSDCEFTESKGSRGGAICVWDGQGFSSQIENCKFSNNIAVEYGGAFFFNKSQSSDNLAGEAVVTNTVFEANTSALGSAVKVNVPAQFKQCLFKENMAPTISGATSAGCGAFVVDDNPNSKVRLESCAFIGNYSGNINPTSNNDGGSAFVANSASTTFFLINCTFYGNIGARGSIYLRYGKMFLVNNTVVGNVGYSSSGTTSGGMTGGTRTDADIQVTHVNNIFAYNYFYTGVEVGLRDWSITSKVYFYGGNNLVGNAKYTPSEGTFQVTNPVSFFYDPDPQYDDPLFAAYTTTTSGLKVPVLDAGTNTIALSEDGVATGRALSKAAVIDPEIEALIPLTDQRGLTRSTTVPSLGSYEYNVISNTIGNISTPKEAFIVSNPVSGYLILKNNLNINKMSIFNTTGKIVYSENNPSAVIHLNIPSGLYLVRFETFTSISTEKLIIK